MAHFPSFSKEKTLFSKVFFIKDLTFLIDVSNSKYYN